MGSLTRLIDADRVTKHSARRGATRMRLRSRLNWFVALAVLGYAASPAGAQPASGSNGTGGGGGTAGGQVGFQQKVNLTPEQQVGESDNVLSYVGQASQVVGRRLQQARQQHDVVKVLCLNDKLSQIDVAGRSVTERKSALAAAAGRHDKELSNHEDTILSVL